MNIFRPSRSRFNYWSLSKLAETVHNKLNAPKKLEMGTTEEWDAWHLEMKKHKLADWLDDKFWDGCQNILFYPYDVYREARYAIKARFGSSQRHRLQADLPKWRYRDYRELLLFSVFDSFVNDFMISEKGRGSVKGLWKNWDWECNITNADCGDINYYGEDKSHPDDELIPQAVDARQMRELYFWWLQRREEILQYKFVSFEEANRLDMIDNEKLKELMDLRLSMWT